MTRGTERLILAGDSGCGKTRTCLAVVDGLREHGWTIAGVVCPGIWANGEKVGIEAMDLRSAEVRRLAERVGSGTGFAGPATPGWQFDAGALAWCNAQLAEAGDTDLLVVDELGPLELERGEGLMQGVRAVDAGRCSLGLVVVRTRLLPIARQRWPEARVLALRNPSEVAAAAAAIIKLAMQTRPSA